jgi:tetratricopeptide (TPR) repeat protein
MRRALAWGALLVGAGAVVWAGRLAGPHAQVGDAPQDPAARIATLERRVQSDPRPDLYFELGRLRLEQGHDDAGLADIARAARTAPEGHYVHAYLADQLDKTKYDHRIDLFEALVRLDPDDPVLLERLGVLYQSVGRDAEAEALFTRWVRLRPGNTEPYARLAEFYRATERPKDAIAPLEKVRAIMAQNGGESTYALRRLGVLYRETGNLDASAARLTTAIAETEGVRKAAAATDAGRRAGFAAGKPEEDVVALVELGHTRLAQKRPADAVAAFREAAALDPKSPAYALFVAEAEREKGDARAAKGAYQEALALDPFNLDARLGFGNLLLAQGDAKGALVQLKEASSRNDRDPDLHFLVGETALKAGDLEAARYEHRKLMQIRSTTLARKLGAMLPPATAPGAPGGPGGPGVP